MSESSPQNAERRVAKRSDSIRDFGRHLRDWLHELRWVSTRHQAAAAIADAPARLREKLADGQVADAWLAAYAERRYLMMAGTARRCEHLRSQARHWLSSVEIFSRRQSICRCHCAPDVRSNLPKRSEKQTQSGNGGSEKLGKKSWRRCANSRVNDPGGAESLLSYLVPLPRGLPYAPPLFGRGPHRVS